MSVGVVCANVSVSVSVSVSALRDGDDVEGGGMKERGESSRVEESPQWRR